MGKTHTFTYIEWNFGKRTGEKSYFLFSPFLIDGVVSRSLTVPPPPPPPQHALLLALRQESLRSLCFSSFHAPCIPTTYLNVSSLVGRAYGNLSLEKRKKKKGPRKEKTEKGKSWRSGRLCESWLFFPPHPAFVRFPVRRGQLSLVFPSIGPHTCRGRYDQNETGLLHKSPIRRFILHHHPFAFLMFFNANMDTYRYKGRKCSNYSPRQPKLHIFSRALVAFHARS